jgi:hypothetical protein
LKAGRIWDVDFVRFARESKPVVSPFLIGMILMIGWLKYDAEKPSDAS